MTTNPSAEPLKDASQDGQVGSVQQGQEAASSEPETWQEAFKSLTNAVADVSHLARSAQGSSDRVAGMLEGLSKGKAEEDLKRQQAELRQGILAQYEAPDDRERMAPMVDAMVALRAEVAEMKLGVAQGGADQHAEVISIAQQAARAMGVQVTPEEVRNNLAANATDADVLAYLGNRVRQGSTGNEAASPSSQQSTQPAGNPPVGAGPRGRGSQQTVEQLDRDLLSGRITTDAYAEKYTQIEGRPPPGY